MSIILPQIREDLQLLPGEQDRKGGRGFLIRDPVRNNFVQASEDTVVLMANWRAGMEGAAFLNFLEREKGIALQPEQLVNFISFLSVHQLIIGDPQERPDPEAGKSAAKKIFEQFLHHYLFFKIPLFYPDRFLRRTVHLVSFFYKRPFWIITGLIFLFDILAIVPRLDVLKSAIQSQGNFELVVKFALAFVISKVLHELSHAYMAVRYKCMVSSLGLGFMVAFPVFYADVTDTWRLTDHRQRLHVAVAGIGAELVLAIYATALWILNPFSFLSQVFLYLAMATWVSSVLINFNPLMRFDGYYILSDMLNEKNLQAKAFAAARGVFRGIFGFAKKADQPKTFHKVFGFAMMWYRVLVITGIALLLYHFVFRLLGLFLFAVEIWWFLLRPLLSEAQFFWKNRAELDMERFKKRGALALAGLLILFFMPFNTFISAPAILTREQVSRIYTTEAGQMAQELPRVTRLVAQGEPVISLTDPSRQNMLEQQRMSVDILQQRLGNFSIAETDRNSTLAIQAELDKAESKRAAAERQLAVMSPKAPYAGSFVPIEPLRDAQWVPARSPLGELVGGGTRVVAFVSEHDLALVSVGSRIKFFSDFDMAGVEGKVVSVSYAAAPTLMFPELSSPYGGPITARGSASSGIVSEKAIYRIEALVESAELAQRITGTALIETSARSLVQRVLSSLVAVLRREAYVY